jgi:hypothetical protein
MHPQFIIVTDRGALRAGWLESAALESKSESLLEPLLKAETEGSLHRPPPGRMPVTRPPRFRSVAAIDFVHPRQHFVEQVTDLSGNYSAAASSGMSGAPRRMPSSSSDVHWKLEADRRAVADLARTIGEILQKEKPETWILSAPADIHASLVEHLAQSCRGRLLGVIPKNLVSSDHESLVAHFEPFLRGATGAVHPRAD